MMIRAERLHFFGGLRLASAFLMAGLVILVICMSLLSKQTARVEAAPANNDDDDAPSTYLGQAKKLIDSGTHHLTQSSTKQQSRASSSFPLGLLSASASASASTSDPQLEQQLRQSIKIATDLINNYRQNGLSSLPSLPNLPGVSTVMRLPDKLLRAELSMIQDEIRMAMEMMNNPLAATMNAPRDIASMFYRMAEQLEQ